MTWVVVNPSKLSLKLLDSFEGMLFKKDRREVTMEIEIKNLFKVWITVYASLTFCYFFISKIPKGKYRLLSLIPIFTLFTLLPLSLQSMHCIGITTLFITWLANFKLLLFAFNQGPLSSNPSISLIHFISTATLPIKIKDNPSLQTPQNDHIIINKKCPVHETTKKGLKSPFNYSIKVLLLALVLHVYKYRPYMHHNMFLAILCCHIYLQAEIILAMSAAPAQAMGFELEPQFEEPYLSISLQDFWGRRWNLMVSSILRSTVYEPIRSSSTSIVGSKCSLLLGVMGAFVVSGLMHELIYFYQSRVRPTWEVTWFFVLHGVCTILEIEVKKKLKNKWRLHPFISRVLTIGFVMVTGFWLFFPQMVRNGMAAGAIAESKFLIDFVKTHILKM